MGRGVSGDMGVSQHMCTCIHMHARTCIHVQKLQMAADMEASMFIMFNMFNMYVHVCVCAHACIHGTPLHTPMPSPTPIHPPAPPPPRGPIESVKIQ